MIEFGASITSEDGSKALTSSSVSGLGAFNSFCKRHEKTKAYLLFDGDIVAYKAASSADGRGYSVGKTPHVFKYKKDAVAYAEEHGWSKEDVSVSYTPEDEASAISLVNSFMRQCTRVFENIPTLEHTRVLSCISPKTCFRNKLYPAYKQNRRDVRRPEHLVACKESIIRNHNGFVSEDYEADDLLGIFQVATDHSRHKPNNCVSVLGSVDKDLDMIPGWHFNWMKRKVYFISNKESLYNFYIQLLTGDKVDNIPGLHKVGKVTAKKILYDVPRSDWTLYKRVLFEYFDRCEKRRGESMSSFMTRVIKQVTDTGRLLWICRSHRDLWIPPIPPGYSEEASRSIRELLTDETV